jgi:DNA repair protein RadC
VGGKPLSSPEEATDFLRMRLAALDREVFLLILLDTRHRVLAAEPIFMGTIDGAEVHPRVVARLALQHNAAAVICAHNHPSQSPEPSAADRAVTAQLKQALALFDIRLLDHFVVTAGGCTSLAARGWV